MRMASSFIRAEHEGGVEGDHFLVCPPLSVSSEQVVDILRLLEESLEQFAETLPAFPNIKGSS